MKVRFVFETLSDVKLSRRQQKYHVRGREKRMLLNILARVRIDRDDAPWTRSTQVLLRLQNTERVGTESETPPVDGFSLRILFAHVGFDSSVDGTMNRWETHQCRVEKLQVEKPSFQRFGVGGRDRGIENGIEALIHRLPSHCQQHNRRRLIARQTIGGMPASISGQTNVGLNGR